MFLCILYTKFQAFLHYSLRFSKFYKYHRDTNCTWWSCYQSTFGNCLIFPIMTSPFYLKYLLIFYFNWFFTYQHDFKKKCIKTSHKESRHVPRIELHRCIPVFVCFFLFFSFWSSFFSQTCLDELLDNCQKQASLITESTTRTKHSLSRLEAITYRIKLHFLVPIPPPAAHRLIRLIITHRYRKPKRRQFIACRFIN